MDWHIFYGGVGAGLGIVGVTSGLVWLIITLVTRPLKDDIEEIKRDLHVLLPSVKSESELDRMISLRINSHKDACIKVQSAIISHEKQYHSGGMQ